MTTGVGARRTFRSWRSAITSLVALAVFSPSACSDQEAAREPSSFGTSRTAPSVVEPVVEPVVDGLERLGTAPSEPVRIAFAGSSTTAGNGASSASHRYVDQLVAAMQDAHPTGGVDSAVIDSTTADWGPLSSADGIHAYNAGTGGATSGSYLSADNLAKVAALDPVMVVHMVGANDYGNQGDPSIYEMNLIAAIADLDAAISTGAVHVLVQQHGRLDISPAPYDWGDYGAAMAEVAATDPDDIIFIDVSDDFDVRGASRGDPNDLIGSDDIHLTDAGHDLLADVIGAELLDRS